MSTPTLATAPKVVGMSPVDNFGTVVGENPTPYMVF